MALFERALEEDSDNPLLPAQAMLVYGAEYPRALPIFKKALDRWPDHPFGGWMALNVVAQTGEKSASSTPRLTSGMQAASFTRPLKTGRGSERFHRCKPRA